MNSPSPTLHASLFATLCLATTTLVSAPLDLANRREIFADRYLIESTQGVQLTPHEPRNEGPVLRFDQPWEGAFSGYVTIVHDAPLYRAYYRGKPDVAPDGEAEVTC